MLCDSHSTKPSSSIVGTSEFGFIFRYSGVLVTPNCIPASTRSYLRPSSSTHHSAFLTLTELVLPQIFSISPCLLFGGGGPEATDLHAGAGRRRGDQFELSCLVVVREQGLAAAKRNRLDHQ